MTHPSKAAIDAAGAPVLTVHTGALADNWRLISKRAGRAECAAVVKANAYGTGIEGAVPALHQAGARTFFVAHLSEGRRVRAAAPNAVIYVLHGLPPGAAALFHAIDARPVLGSAEEVAEWQETGRNKPAAVHVDTGMNRLGLRLDETQRLVAQGAFSGVELALVMSHFVSSEVPGDPMNSRQIDVFAKVRQLFPSIPASLSNSSGAYLEQQAAYDLVRPGYALYGGNPTPATANPMRPVVRLEAPVVTVRTVPAGEAVGYNGQWTAHGERRIAIASTGYADGYDRRATSTDTKPGGHVRAGGVLCPIAGRVSMDLIAIDVTEVPQDGVDRGDRIALIDDELTVDRVATQMGTIGYELLTRLSARIHRVYRPG